MFDPKSGSCIPAINVEGAQPRGTLECPQDFILDETLNMCVPETPSTQAGVETSAPFKPSAKMERCIRDVKANLSKRNPKFKDQNIKSAAIAICRSRLKA